MAPEKRAAELLDALIEQHLLPVDSFIGAVLIGSRAHGEERPESDIDVVLIFEEVDERVIPGEFVWVPETNSFHSIFDIDADGVSAIQVDAIGRRLSWLEFSEMEWPEGLRHDLSAGPVLVERRRDVSGVIAARTAYPEELRIERLAEAVGWAEYHLKGWRLEGWIERGGWLCANDQVDAAFEQLISALHAYNRTWLPWRYRRLLSALRLPWLPPDFAGHVEALRRSSADDPESLRTRASHVATPLRELLERADNDGLTPDLEAAGGRRFSGLGFASTMEEWRRQHDEWLQEQSGS